MSCVGLCLAYVLRQRCLNLEHTTWAAKAASFVKASTYHPSGKCIGQRSLRPFANLQDVDVAKESTNFLSESRSAKCEDTAKIGNCAFGVRARRHPFGLWSAQPCRLQQFNEVARKENSASAPVGSVYVSPEDLVRLRLRDEKKLPHNALDCVITVRHSSVIIDRC
jgi:hypothetical protein